MQRYSCYNCCCHKKWVQQPELKSENHKKIILCWILSHIGMRGNERADSAAKSALDLSPKAISIPYTDLKPIISKFLHKKWQQ